MSLSIKLHSWNIFVSPTVLGRQNDQNCQTVTVTGDIPTGWDWYLLLGLGHQYNAYLMSHEDESLTVVLDETALTQSGPYQVQLKAIQLEDPSIIQHTNATTVLVERTVTGDASWSKSIGEFSQIEERIQKQAAQITQQSSAMSSLVQQAESLALQCQEAAASSQHSAEQVQSTLETINQQADSCQTALSQVEAHTTQAVTAKEQAESASIAAQAAATAAQEMQEAATSACAQAQTYLADTQNARDEAVQCAQDLQHTLDQIYTKQECHSQFAGALIADTGKGTSHQIYPDAGSNMMVTAYGYTQQEGDGTPSPKNIRPITIRPPRYMYQYVFTGEETFTNTTVGGTAKWVAVKPTGFSGTFGEGLLSRYDYLSGNFSNESYPFGYNMAWTSSIYVRHQDLDATGMKTLFESEYERGHPFMAWYNKRDSTGIILPTTTGFSEQIKIKADTTQHQRNICLPVTIPMTEGSSIVTVKGGQCVETHTYGLVILTGTENWSTGANERIYTPLPNSKEYGTSYCSHATKFDGDPGRFGVISGSYLAVSPGGQWGDAFHDLTSWKAYLSAQMQAGTPVTVVYQLQTPITYTHSPMDLVAQPDSAGKQTIQSSCDISVTYNHSISHAFQELQSAILAMGAQ